MSGKIEFKKLRDFGEVINDTFLFIRENFRPLIKMFIYLCGFFILAGIIAAVMQQLNLQAIGANPNNPFAGGINNLFTWNYFLVIFISMGTYTAITVSTLSFIALYIQKGKVAPNPEEVWAYFKYYFFRAFFSSIGVGLFLTFAFILCLLPGIYVFPAMSLFFPVMILENAGFIYTFNRSFKLLKNQWWLTAGVILVIWVIAYSCMMFASAPGFILTMVGTFIPGAKEWSKVMVIVGTILQYISYAFMMIPVIGVALCYFNLVEVQESSGLMDRINQFGEEKNGDTSLEEY
ncbi:hypothetical protein [Pedobacter heparinus]|uniref:hypothetical protein n=1 Tax=Pedobacter heparinus TaxID=984 RepID=UPI00292CBFA6|nr:hypothetical protein [Pedobacter heparinus]